MHARSALFDLYGDHLRTRGDQAPVAVLVRLLAPLGVTGPAVRTSISRMVRQGWLRPVRLAAGPGYALTDQARSRLDEAATRIYRTREPAWTGSWDLLVLEPLPSRSVRERVRSGLGYLGYAPLSDSTWISPAVSPEAEALLAAEGAVFSRFAAQDGDPAEQAARAWDLDALAAAYRSWRAFAGALVADPDGAPRQARRRPRRARLRGPLAARARVAQVPVHRPRPARRPAAAGLGRRRGG